MSATTSTRTAFNAHASLIAPLPPLVRKQRRLASAIAKLTVQLEPELAKDKATRDAIDALLLKAGLAKGDVVTCLGYDVRHNERDGHVKFDSVTLTALLLWVGCDPEFIDAVVGLCTTQGEPSKFATVSPTKGAIVRQVRSAAA